MMPIAKSSPTCGGSTAKPGWGREVLRSFRNRAKAISFKATSMPAYAAEELPSNIQWLIACEGLKTSYAKASSFTFGETL